MVKEVRITQENNFTPRHIPERNENIHPHKDLHGSFLTTLFIIGPNWKQPADPSTGE